MKRLLNISTFVVFLFGIFVLGGCTNDFDSDKIGPNKNGSSDYIVINFASAQDDIVVQTRAQNLDDQNENRVRNLYVFIFNEAGKKVYAKYFDSSNKVENVDAGGDDDCWSVVNTSNTEDSRTQGKIKIHTTSNEADTYKIYAITNLDSSFVDISSDRLSQIQSEEELLETKGRLLQQTVSRSGYLQMSGKLENVKIHEDGHISDTTDNEITLLLCHMDAKVQVTLQQGSAIRELTNARIQIMNLPKESYVWSKYNNPSDRGSDAVTKASETFDSPLVSFDQESQESSGGGLVKNTYDAWFYMLESRQIPKKSIPMECPDADWEAFDPEKTNYNPYFERARQNKNTEPMTPGYGHNLVDANGDLDFMYANNLSPYMVVQCSINMELTGEEAGQELGGDIVYIIPLGDAGSSTSATEEEVNNYNTNRNTFYHYTITVNGVHNVRVEVDARGSALTETEKFQPEENQPGASGHVVVAREDIAICDCHYVSKTITFHAINVSDSLTWHVSTPFGEGGPEIDMEGNDVIPPGLDYEWVHFRVNNKTSSGSYYSDQRRAFTTDVYDPVTKSEGLMNVSQLVRYMKDQKKLFDTEDPDMPESWTSDFDNGYKVVYDSDGNVDGTEIDDINGDGFPDRKICVTAFVNEFYYDYNPLNPLEPIPNDFWKKYVNYPTDRYMYILSESNLSRDEESRATGSVITIQQHPIQSIYDTDPNNTSVKSAWGLELEDDFPDIWSYWSRTSGGEPGDERGNTDTYNGRLNTIKEWDLYESETQITDGVRWDNFMNFEVRNDVPQLRDNYKYLRYSCMTRNRDNDGDGYIDQDEIRWYMAAVKQLTGLAIGRDVLTFRSRLYNRSEAQKSQGFSSPEWRQHVISSTASSASNSNNPIVVWGEEITSVSSMTNSTAWAYLHAWSIRCLRNLGTDNETLKSGYNLVEDVPDDYIEVRTDGVYASSPQVTCSRINPLALRAQQDTELVYCDENNEQTRLSKRFYIAPTDSELPTLPDAYRSKATFINHNEWIEAVGSSVDTGHCPEGYRVPNMLELTIMYNYANSFVYYNNYGDQGYYLCRNVYSFGNYGAYAKPETGKVRTGWMANNGSITVEGNPNRVRCVRDASVEELQADGLL